MEAPRDTGIDPDTVRGWSDLAALLDARPEAATPALVRRLKERVEALYRTDAQAADALADCVFHLAQQCADAESMALGHRAKGLAALAVGSSREAIAHYEAAERLYRQLGNEVERARVLRSMIDALMHLGRYDEALAAGRQAQEIFQRHGLRALAAQVETNVGNVYYRMDRNAESLEAQNRALRIFRELEDHEAVAVTEFNRANIFSNLNDLADAERGYRRALRFFRERGFRVREAQCLYKLAYLAYLRFRYSEALALFERVRALQLELGDRQWAALCTLSQTELLLSSNSWEEAAAQGTDAQRTLEELGLEYEATKAALFRGLAAVHVRDFEQAEALLEEAGRRFREGGNEVFQGLTDVYRAELALLRDQPAVALGLSRGAARLFARESLHAKEATARIVAARALRGLARPASARRQGFLALARVRRHPSAWVAYQAHHLLGVLEPDPERARRHFDDALAAVERLRAHVVPDELRASFHRDKVSLYEDYARLLLSGSGAARIEAAFEVVELAKSRKLSDLTARPPLEAETADGLQSSVANAELRRELEELNGVYRLLNDAELTGRPQSAGDALRREIDEREARLSLWFRRVELARSQELAASPGSEREVLPRVQATLAPDEALVEFFVLDKVVRAFVVRAEGIRWIGCGPSLYEVRETLERLRFQMEKAHLGKEYVEARRPALRAAALHYLESLSVMLWAPMAGALSGIRKLVLVPAGPLFYVPFHALRAGDRYLIQDFEIGLAPSARMHLAARGRRSASSHAALVLGGLRPELPAIELEIDAVRGHVPDARVLLGPAATRGALRRLGGGASVIHIASHAIFRGDNPLLSAIELADGRLTFYDLFDLRLDSDLVVLSGCQTGRHRVLEGDELMGLARGFTHAGAASLLASLWPVDDAAAAHFMDRFYAGLGGGNGPRAALRAAMCELIESGLDVWEWAPFYVSGKAEAAAVGPRERARADEADGTREKGVEP